MKGPDAIGAGQAKALDSNIRSMKTNIEHLEGMIWWLALLHSGNNPEKYVAEAMKNAQYGLQVKKDRGW